MIMEIMNIKVWKLGLEKYRIVKLQMCRNSQLELRTV